MAIRVLILCTGNSARSQMAEGLLRHDGGGEFEVFSAGTHPSAVRPEAIAVMAEVGIDISSHWSKSVDEYIDQEFDVVMTVCSRASENCPTFPGKYHRVTWDFDDPASVQGDEAVRLDAFRRVRDQIRLRLVHWKNGIARGN